MHNISKDVQRYKDILKGKIKTDLQKYITREEILLNNKGKVSIPLPQIELPKFKYGDEEDGVGQGDPQADESPVDNSIELEVTIDDLATMLGDELQLPRIKPKGSREVVLEKKYKQIRRVGPESLLSLKHTFKESLKREIASGTYDPDNPNLVPIKEDKRYKAAKQIVIPKHQAVILHMMDVSGSMDEERKTLARYISFWINAWLKKNYKHSAYRYLIHNTDAREVSEQDFFKTKEGGGTTIDSVYKLGQEIILKDYATSDWNIYMFHYSDGDDSSEAMSEKAIRRIKDFIGHINQFAYCQIHDSGKFRNLFDARLKNYSNAVSAYVKDKEAILDALKTFLSAGK